MSALIWKLPQNAGQIHNFYTSGGIFAYPTEAVWAIGCDPSNENAVRQVIALKARPKEKGLIMVAANWKQAQDWIGAISPEDQKAMQELQAQRPTTFILPAGEKVAPSVRDAQTDRVALRISQHPTIARLCALVQAPLLSTSANPAGKEAARSLQALRAYFPNLPLVEGALGKAQRPSRIIDWQYKVVLRD